GPEDRDAPAAPTELSGSAGDLPAGEAFVSWKTPADKGAAGTVGFLVKVDGKDVPRYLIPKAGRPGTPAVMHVRDLKVAPGATLAVAVRAVDGAGNVGPAASARIRVSGQQPKPLPGRKPEPFQGTGPLPRLGKREVAVIDELDKVQSVSGIMVPAQPAN